MRLTKTYVMHFRKLGKLATKFELKINNRLDIVNSCQYLRVVFNQYLNYHDSVNAHMVLGNRTLGSIISKRKKLKA